MKEYLETRSSRRNFLKLAGAATGLLLLEACGSPSPTIPPTTVFNTLIPTPERVNQNEYASEQKRLKEIIKALPETEIKKLLLEKVVPILDNPSGTTVLNLDGVPIKVHGIKMTHETQFTNKVLGSFRPMGNPDKLESFFPAEEQILKMPYLDLIKPEEKKKYPSNIASDGSFFINVTFPPTKPFHEGFAPTIDIITIHPSIQKPEAPAPHTFFENTTYLKEACSLLIYLLTLEDMIKQMHQLDFKTYLDVGNKMEIEGVNRSLVVIGANYGRLTAAQDLAAYLLAVKALGDKFNLDYIIESQRQFYEQIKNTPIGNDPSKILEQSFQWAMSLDPKKIPVDYQGNLNKIP